MQKATARWSGTKVRFDIESGSGHSAAIDESTHFGEDSGMRPTEALLGALGACTGINAVLLLKKYKQPYSALAVEVEGDQENEWPHRFTAIRINFVIDWAGEFDQAKVDEALDLAANKYCPVDATLSRGTQIEFRRTDQRAQQADERPFPRPD